MHSSAHMAICDLLTELGARHQAADLATATAVLDDAIETIAENIFAEDCGCLSAKAAAMPAVVAAGVADV